MGIYEMDMEDMKKAKMKKIKEVNKPKYVIMNGKAYEIARPKELKKKVLKKKVVKKPEVKKPMTAAEKTKAFFQNAARQSLFEHGKF